MYAKYITYNKYHRKFKKQKKKHLTVKSKHKKEDPSIMVLKHQLEKTIHMIFITTQIKC